MFFNEQKQIVFRGKSQEEAKHEINFFSFEQVFSSPSMQKHLQHQQRSPLIRYVAKIDVVTNRACPHFPSIEPALISIADCSRCFNSECASPHFLPSSLINHLSKLNNKQHSF